MVNILPCFLVYLKPFDEHVSHFQSILFCHLGHELKVVKISAHHDLAPINFVLVGGCLVNASVTFSIKLSCKVVFRKQFRQPVIIPDCVVVECLEIIEYTLLQGVNTDSLVSVFDCWEDALFQKLSLLLGEHIYSRDGIMVNEVVIPVVVIKRPVEQRAVTEV